MVIAVSIQVFRFEANARLLFKKVYKFCWKSVLLHQSQDNVVSVVTHNVGFSSQQCQVMFLFSETPKPALRPFQPLIQWVLGIKQLGHVTLTTHIHQVLRLSGTLSLLSLYAFMVWIGTHLSY